MTICPRCRKGLKDRGSNRKKLVTRKRRFWPKSVYVHKVCPPVEKKPKFPASEILHGQDVIRYFQEVIKS